MLKKCDMSDYNMYSFSNLTFENAECHVLLYRLLQLLSRFQYAASTAPLGGVQLLPLSSCFTQLMFPWSVPLLFRGQTIVVIIHHHSNDHHVIVMGKALHRILLFWFMLSPTAAKLFSSATSWNCLCWEYWTSIWLSQELAEKHIRSIYTSHAWWHRIPVAQRTKMHHRIIENHAFRKENKCQAPIIERLAIDLRNNHPCLTFPFIKRRKHHKF